MRKTNLVAAGLISLALVFAAPAAWAQDNSATNESKPAQVMDWVAEWLGSIFQRLDNDYPSAVSVTPQGWNNTESLVHSHASSPAPTSDAATNAEGSQDDNDDDGSASLVGGGMVPVG